MEVNKEQKIKNNATDDIRNINNRSLPKYSRLLFLSSTEAEGTGRVYTKAYRTNPHIQTEDTSNDRNIRKGARCPAITYQISPTMIG